MSLCSLGGSNKNAENTIFENGDLNDLKQTTLLTITWKATFSDKRVLNVSHQIDPTFAMVFVVAKSIELY